MDRNITKHTEPELTGLDSPLALRRLGVCIGIGTIGSIGMWSFVVALPAVQAGFGVSRGEASFPYTMTMIGFAFGGVLMGKLADRTGIVLPLVLGGLLLGLGYFAAAAAPSLTVYALAQLVVGLGTSASFAPLMVDISRWFVKRRGIAVAVAGSGNYLAGVIWPPLLTHFIASHGWRPVHAAIGAVCIAVLVPAAFLLRRRPPDDANANAVPVSRFGVIELPRRTMLLLLTIAGVACCVAMAMPQVHLVAYCADLGYGAARGAEMLSLMLGLGIVSRVLSGLIADRIGGLAALILGSALQGLALFLYLFFDGLVSLYIISGLFGLFQGGLVPMYAVIVREYFPAARAGGTLGVIIMATLFGMALGGWMSGYIYDVTGSYRLAFLNGLLWNLVNVAIAAFLLLRRRVPAAPAPA
ncbi:MAG: MFS transporter [Beijerinckiaceae bacterium]